jgi:hypothetical protein
MPDTHKPDPQVQHDHHPHPAPPVPGWLPPGEDQRKRDQPDEREDNPDPALPPEPGRDINP